MCKSAYPKVSFVWPKNVLYGYGSAYWLYSCSWVQPNPAVSEWFQMEPQREPSPPRGHQPPTRWFHSNTQRKHIPLRYAVLFLPKYRLFSVKFLLGSQNLGKVNKSTFLPSQFLTFFLSWKTLIRSNFQINNMFHNIQRNSINYFS